MGGVDVPVAGPVAQGQYLGLDQVNVGPLPGRVGYGEKEVLLRVGGELANAVTVRLRTP